eukprot:symbB.v1.2.016113.t1/scaffold1219.1/size131098/5
MIQVNVALPNGHAELLTLLPSSTVQDVQIKAKRAFGKKELRLITAKNRVLVDLEQTIEGAEIEDGECLTALVLQPQLAATRGAFASWSHGDSAIVTWGDPGFGGHMSAVRDQLKGVQHIHATIGAFAAILEDGSVVTWGYPHSGGGSSAVRDQLKGVLQIQATLNAFAAILEDGSVVSWGDEDWGGDSSGVRDQLRGVQQIQASERAFAAILADGSVVTWGDADLGGDSSGVRDQLRSVQQIQASQGAFAAILADGSVVTWGDADFGSNSSEVQDQLKNVQQIQATDQAFAAILADGSVVTWGDALCGGDSSAVQDQLKVGDQLKGVQQIQASTGAFAAILEDGSVVSWGNEDSGGDSSAVQDELKGVQQIQATRWAFAAILADGSVVTWSDALCGGDSSAVQDQLKGVQQIQATRQAFAAILDDGSVVTWGHALCGGDNLSSYIGIILVQVLGLHVYRFYDPHAAAAAFLPQAALLLLIALFQAFADGGYAVEVSPWLISLEQHSMNLWVYVCRTTPGELPMLVALTFFMILTHAAQGFMQKKTHDQVTFIGLHALFLGMTWNSELADTRTLGFALITIDLTQILITGWIWIQILQMQRLCQEQDFSWNKLRLQQLPEMCFQDLRRTESVCQENCIICLTDYDDSSQVSRLACGHVFHANCIKVWLSGKKCASCPYRCHGSPLDFARGFNPREFQA